jgi:hypothetical protein
MKKLNIFLMVVAILVASACEDFLTVQPVSVIGEEGLLNKQGIDWMVTGMYSTLYAQDPYSALINTAYGDVIGGIANKGSDPGDRPNWSELQLFIFNGTNEFITTPWNSQYNGVSRANAVLDMLQKASDQLDIAYITQTEAQARFIRGLWYFQLIQYYGAAVPWVGLEEYQSATNPLVSNVDESGNYIYIWDKVVEDFQFAYDNLPDDWTDNGQIGNPNKWAALAYKVKVMMFQSSPYNGTNGGRNRWAEVKTDLENLMANGVTSNGLPYALHKSYEELFNAKTSDNTSENVLRFNKP